LIQRANKVNKEGRACQGKRKKKKGWGTGKMERNQGAQDCSKGAETKTEQ